MMMMMMIIIIIIKQFRKQKCDKKKSREDYKTQRPYTKNTAHVECKNEVITVVIGTPVTISKS